MMVCQDHVIRGLRILPAPHVHKIPNYIKSPCTFCNQQATYKLYLSDRTIHFIIQKKQRKKREEMGCSVMTAL